MTQGKRPRTNRRRTAVTVTLAGVTAALAMLPASALGFGEFYGGGSICGSNCYVQSAGAHTFAYNEGASEGGTALACQLFNGNGVNEVAHGSGICDVFYVGGQFVWARVYNQSGKTELVGGYAET